MEDYYYKVYCADGECHRYINRGEAFDYYRVKNGVRIETVTKDLYPEVKVVVDRQGFNLEQVREDLTLKETSEALRRAIDKYDKKNTKQIAIKLNKNTDADIIEYLDSIENKQGLIKELIRKEMLKTNVLQ